MTAEILRVLLADDEPDVHLLVRLALAATKDLALVGEEADGEATLSRWRGLDPKPDVVVLDHHMPGLTGLDVAAQILAERPSQAVVLFSAGLDWGLRTRADELGVARCVPKERLMDLPQVIRDAVATRDSL